MQSSHELIINLLGNAKDHMDSIEATDNQQVSNPENDFIKRMDTAYQVATTFFSVAASVTSVYFPPAAIAVAGMALIIGALHLYDKSNNYDFSHWMMNKINKLNQSTKELMSGLAFFSHPALDNAIPLTLPSSRMLLNG